MTPATSDEDGSGVSDGIEDFPYFDTLTNQGEQDRGTDPTNPDTDGDGFEDGDEVDLGTDPLDPNSP